uniref:G-protein coupled receptors family 1 profile domain-containing protein n=1 Tax=Trichuris muris TaxID=70415 RepID=A0A5S6QZ00_TRIMR
MQNYSALFGDGNLTAVRFSTSIPLQSTTVVATVRQAVGIISIVVSTFVLFILLSMRKFTLEMSNLTALTVSSQLQGIGSLVTGIRFAYIRHRAYTPTVLASECLLTYADISLGHLNYLLRPLLFVHVGVMGMVIAFAKPYRSKKLRKVNMASLIAVLIISLLYLASVWLEIFFIYSNWFVSQRCEYWTSIPLHHQQIQKYMYMFGVGSSTALLCTVLLAKRCGRKEILNMAEVEGLRRLLFFGIVGLVFRGCPMAAGFFLPRTPTVYTVRMLLYLTDDSLCVCYCAAYCYLHPDIRDYIVDLWSLVADTF